MTYEWSFDVSEIHARSEWRRTVPARESEVVVLFQLMIVKM
jgi:hypothetical protein